MTLSVLGYFDVSIIHQTLTWITESLMCIHDLFCMHIYIREPGFVVSSEDLCRVCTEFDSGGLKVGAKPSM